MAFILLALLSEVVGPADSVSASRIAERLAQISPAYQLYDESMIGADALEFYHREYYRKEPRSGHPGYVCGRFLGNDREQCAVLAIRKGKPGDGPVALLLLRDVLGSADHVTLEGYERWKIPRTHAFMHYQTKTRIPDRTYGGSIRMSGDGFEVILFEQSARTYFWRGKDLVVVQTSD